MVSGTLCVAYVKGRFNADSGHGRNQIAFYFGSGFAQALPGAAGTTAAICCHAEITPQIFHSSGPLPCRLVDLTLGDRLTNAHVHEEQSLANTNNVRNYSHLY